MSTAIIADDNNAFRKAVKRILAGLNWDIAGEAPCGNTALQLVKQTKPDLIILDLSMPKRSGVTIIKDIRSAHPYIKILIVTIHVDFKLPYYLLNEGANGYFVKDEGSKALCEAVSHVMNGETYISPFVR